MTREDKRALVALALISGLLAPSLALSLYVPFAWYEGLVPFYDRTCWPEQCWTWRKVASFAGHALLAFGPVAAVAGGFGTCLLMRARTRVQGFTRFRLLGAVLGAFLGPLCTVGDVLWHPDFYFKLSNEFLWRLLFLMGLPAPFSVPT